MRSRPGSREGWLDVPLPRFAAVQGRAFLAAIFPPALLPAVAHFRRLGGHTRRHSPKPSSFPGARSTEVIYAVYVPSEDVTPNAPPTPPGTRNPIQALGAEGGSGRKGCDGFPWGPPSAGCSGARDCGGLGAAGRAAE